MRLFIIIIFLPSVALFECGDKTETRVKYYSDGHIMLKEEYRGNMRNGLSIEYHQNGSVLKESHYVEGVIEGPAVAYYSNGSIWEQHTFKNGKPIGTSIKYFPNGQIAELRYFDSLSRLVDIKRSKPDGGIDYDNPFPLFSFKDTLNLGEATELFCRIANADSSKYTVGDLVISSDPWPEGDQPIDTVYHMVSTNQRGFTYLIKANAKGEHKIYGALLFPSPDSLGTEEFAFETRYFVK